MAWEVVYHPSTTICNSVSVSRIGQIRNLHQFARDGLLVAIGLTADIFKCEQEIFSAVHYVFCWALAGFRNNPPRIGTERAGE